MSGQYRLIIEPKGALLLGGTSQPGVNDATARDAEGVPFIPATAIKGALREQLVRLLQARQPRSVDATVQRILGSAAARAIGEHDVSARSDGNKERPGGGRTRTYISDARVIDEKLHRVLATAATGLVARHQVSIDRRSRRVAGPRLFSREVVAPFLDDLVFVAEVDATLLAADEDYGSADLQYLRAAAAAIFAIGGARSSGMGHVACRLEPVEREDAGSEATASRPAAQAGPRRTEIPDASSIHLLLEAEESLCVGDRLFLTSNFHASLGYIRGSTLRGALVTAAMRARGTTEDQSADPAFRRMLLDPATCMRFGDAAPVPEDGTIVRPPAVAPLTLRTCKYGGERHGCLDTLVLRWIQQRLAEECSPLAFDEACQFEHEGHRCRQRLVSAPDRLGAADPSRRVVTRLALHTRLGRGADGKLFSIDLLDRGTRFLARIDRIDAEGRRLLEDASRAPIRAGHGRGQGYGRLRIVRADPLQDSPLEERIERLDSSVRQAWEAACAHAGIPAQDPAPGRLFVALTLENDLLPGPASTGLSAMEALETALGLEDARRLYGAVRAGQRGGYDNRDDQFKNLEPVVRARSCVLMTVPDDNGHRRRLAEIEAAGIGSCRDQGYGRVRIADPLHLPGWKPTWRTTS